MVWCKWINKYNIKSCIKIYTFQILMHGSNQKQKKMQLIIKTNQPTKTKKWNQPMWAYRRQRIKGAIKKKWLVGLYKRKQKKQKNKKKCPMFQYLKSMYYIQGLILYLFVLLCCSIWKIIKLRMQTLIHWFEKWNLFTGFIF